MSFVSGLPYVLLLMAAVQSHNSWRGLALRTAKRARIRRWCSIPPWNIYMIHTCRAIMTLSVTTVKTLPTFANWLAITGVKKVKPPCSRWLSAKVSISPNLSTAMKVTCSRPLLNEPPPPRHHPLPLHYPPPLFNLHNCTVLCLIIQQLAAYTFKSLCSLCVYRGTIVMSISSHPIRYILSEVLADSSHCCPYLDW